MNGDLLEPFVRRKNILKNDTDKPFGLSCATMIRQFAIASAGRTASTSLFQSLVDTLSVESAVCPIWDFSPAGLLAQAYAGDRFDYVVAKGETFHFIDHLHHADKSTLVLLTRRDHLRQITSHLVSLRAGRFHAAGPAAVSAFRVARHEFLFAAHLVLMMEQHFATADFSRFDRVERWCFEDLIADFPGHLSRLGLERPRIARLGGVGYDTKTIVNWDEIHVWAEALVPEGLRVRIAEPA